jgi:flagellar hook-associated protein FlgK
VAPINPESPTNPDPINPTPPNPTDPIYSGNSDPKYLADLRQYQNNIYSVNNCLIPQVMSQLDTLLHSIVLLINDSFAPASAGVKDPNAPFDLKGNQSYAEVFSRKNAPRWNGNQLIPESADYFSQYTNGNLMINPDLLVSGGESLLALSASGDREDNTLLINMIRIWNSKFIQLASQESFGINDLYKHLVSFIGDATNENLNFVQEQNILAQQLDDKRNRIMGVSLDEEMKNMMIYQHAYAAAARILNVIDSMLQSVITMAS